MQFPNHEYIQMTEYQNLKIHVYHMKCEIPPNLSILLWYLNPAIFKYSKRNHE